MSAKNKLREEKIYYLKQKFWGTAMFIVGILTPFVCDGDATFSLVALPLGLYLMFTKEKAMTF